MTCNVVWLRQALTEYQNRLNNILLVTAAEIPALEWRRDKIYRCRQPAGAV